MIIALIVSTRLLVVFLMNCGGIVELSALIRTRMTFGQSMMIDLAALTQGMGIAA